MLGFYYRETSHPRSFAKINPREMAKSPPFNDVGESCPSREILICENKTVANLFEYTVDNNARSFAAWLCSQFYDVTTAFFFQDASNLLYQISLQKINQ